MLLELGTVGTEYCSLLLSRMVLLAVVVSLFFVLPARDYGLFTQPFTAGIPHNKTVYFHAS